MTKANAAVVLIAMLCGRAWGQQASIAGIALDSVTHQLLAGVHISLRPNTGGDDEQPAAIWGAISKQDGRFSIASVPAGTYDLSAQRNGYMQLVSVPVQGAAEAVPRPSTLTLKTGENVVDLRVEMTAEAVITGHIFDENGDPLQRFLIEAEPVRGVGGLASAARTDERGQFRLVLWPGKFYLKAESIRSPVGLPVEGDAGEPVYLATWYPASQTRSSATVIEVGPGQQITDVDFHLTPTRTLRISGRVSGILEAGKVADVLLAGNPGNRSFPSGPDGKFSFAGLPAGQYRLRARFDAGPKSMESRIAELRLENADETGVVLTLVPGETVSGMVEIAGGSPKAAGLDKLNVQLFWLGTIYSEPRRSPVDSEGRFRIDDVFPGRFEIGVLPLPENAYLKSVKVDNAEASDDIIDFSKGVSRANVRVTISLDTATLEGRVVASDGKPAPNHGFVFLGNTPERMGSDHLKESGPDGSFRFTGLRRANTG